jgi:hypothetical protein
VCQQPRSQASTGQLTESKLQVEPMIDQFDRQVGEVQLDLHDRELDYELV